MGLIPQLKITGLSDPGNIATLNKWADGVRVELNSLAKIASVGATGASGAVAATGSIVGSFPPNEVLASPNGLGGALVVRALGRTDLPSDVAYTDVANTFTQTNTFKGLSIVYDLNNVVIPQMFGAVQDGVTDNSTALQAAITYVQAHNGVLWIPPGPAFAYSTTLRIDNNGGTPFGMVIEGSYAKVSSPSFPGSGLLYTGTADAILIEGATAGTFTYCVSIRNLFIGASAAATNLIHLFNTEGPCIFDQCNLQSNLGGSYATNGIFFDNGSGAGSGCGIQDNVTNCFIENFSGAGIKVNSGGPFNFVGNQFFNLATGIYIGESETVTIADSYFELMIVGIEITNDYETYGRYDIHGNQFTIGDSQPIGAPVNTVSQRALLVKSTVNAQPIYMQGSFKHNAVQVGPGFTQGIALYGIEFDAASNTYFSRIQWEIEDNLICGMTTSGIYADSPTVTVIYRDNVCTTFFTTGSVTPVLLPQVSGSGTFETYPYLTGGNLIVTGSIFSTIPGQGSLLLLPVSGGNFIESGNAAGTLPQSLVFSGPGGSEIPFVSFFAAQTTFENSTGPVTFLLQTTAPASNANFEIFSTYTSEVLFNSSGPTATSFSIGTNVDGASGEVDFYDNTNSKLIMSIWPNGGLTVGTPTGGNKGLGTINAAGDYYANGTAGVTAGPYTIINSITVTNGLVTAITGS